MYRATVDRITEYSGGSGDGSGFGPAIVRTLAEAHGLGVDAIEGEDGGARFEVHIGG